MWNESLHKLTPNGEDVICQSNISTTNILINSSQPLIGGSKGKVMISFFFLVCWGGVRVVVMELELRHKPKGVQGQLIPLKTENI